MNGTHWGPRRRPRLQLLASLLVALGLAAAACGSDDSGDAADSDSGEGSGTSAESGGPITIEHSFGSTEIPETPERIVSLNVQWTDVLVSLGVEPVGHAIDPNAGESGLYPWQTDLSDDITPLELSPEALPLEQIASLEPDLILATWVATDEATYESLSEIAPTLPLLTGPGVDRWQDMTEVAGEILGLEDEAADVVAEVDQLVADTAAELPGLTGKTIALANYVPGDMIYVVTDPEDGANVLFQDVGMELDPELAAAPGAESGRTPISLEQAGMLDSDVLVIFSNAGDPHDLVGYDQLPAVTAGSVAELDYAEVVGLNTPSPLSIPYSLEFIRPALDAAGAG
jgi:iron complex transport system substrate-binding protein